MTFKIISTGKAGARCVNLADGVECRIPNDWLKEACEAGYAATVHRSQGMTVDRCAALFPSDSNSACNLQYVAGTRGKEENHFLFGCKSEEDRHIDHMLTGVEEDPRKIAMSRMLDSLLTHTETMTATETMEQEYKDRYDLKRLLREHDYAAGLIAGPHLLAMLGKTHDARTVDKIKRSPSFEWLRGVWSRAYMTDPKRATAIISQSLEKKPRRLTAEKAEHAAIHAARGMMLAAGTETGGTFTLDMDAPSDMIETVRHMMDETGIPYHEEPSLDPGRSRFSMDERYTPAVKAMLDAHIQARDDIDQSMFPEWEALRKTARGIINDDPDLKKKNRLFGGFPFFIRLKSRYSRRIFQLGLPVALLNSLFAVINLMMARTASTYGGHIGLMTMTAGGQIEAIAWNTSQGFSTALSTFVAQNFAARKKERVLGAYHTTLKMTALFGIFCTLLFVFFGSEVFSLIIPEKAAYEAGGVFLRIDGYSMLFMMLEITMQGLFYGTGRTLPPAIISITFNSLRIPMAIGLTAMGLGITGVWWAISISSMLKGIVAFIWFRILQKKIL